MNYVTDEQFKTALHYAINAVIAQSKPSISDESIAACAYRGKDGLKCAIGHLIADEGMPYVKEGQDSFAVLTRLAEEQERTGMNFMPLLPGNLSTEQRQVLNLLQSCHDDAAKAVDGGPGKFVDYFKDNLRSSFYGSRASLLPELA